MSAHTQLAAKQATDPNSLLQIRNTRRIQFTVADPQVRGPLALCDHSCRSTRRLARSNACTPCLAQSPTVCASVCIARTSRPRLAYGIPQPAQGNSAVIAVTGIATNRAPARCECRTVWGCNCTVPDATYLGNGTLLLLPTTRRWRQRGSAAKGLWTSAPSLAAADAAPPRARIGTQAS